MMFIKTENLIVNIDNLRLTLKTKNSSIYFRYESFEKTIFFGSDIKRDKVFDSIERSLFT